MTTRTIQPTLDKALSRSPKYTQPSAEVVALRAEVAAWRGAVRWVGGENVYSLRIGAPSGDVHELASMWLDRDGWRAVSYGKLVAGPILDRDAVFCKVCELLGLPVVLPTAAERRSSIPLR